MAKPAILQDLLHGKILSKKVFPDFVETWNYIIHRCQNLRGDGDINPTTGYIKVDNTNPDFPVIRYSPPVEMNSTYRADSDTLSAYSLDLYRNIIVSDDMSADCGSIFGLHDFDSLSNQVKPSPISAYDMVTRYIKDGIPYVKYVALSSLSATGGNYVSGDADYDSNLSSVKTFELSGSKIVRLFNFDNPDEDFELGFYDVAKLTSDPSYTILVRDDNTKKQRYATLKGFDSLVSGDSQYTGGSQNSITLKEGNNNNYLQLYKFDNPDTDLLLKYNDLTGLTAGYQILVRDNGTLRYASLSGWQHDLSGDANFDDATHFSISSAVRNDGQTQFQLYRFENPDLVSSNIILSRKDEQTDNRYRILVRDGNTKKLTYARLSVGQDEISGDSEFGDSYSIQTIDKGNSKEVQLYNFNGNIGTTISADFQDSNYTNSYWNGLTGIYIMPKSNYGENTQFINRFPDWDGTGKNTIDYSNMIIKLPRYSRGDANVENTATSSIVSFVVGYGDDANPQYKIYNFDEDTQNVQEIKLSSYSGYYNNGEKMLEFPIDGDTMMRRGTTTKYVDYSKPSIEIPPFVHGDSDSYVCSNSSTRSIESKPDTNNPDKTYYQLYNFDDSSSYSTVRSDMLSDNYVDLATGTKVGEGNHYYQFLTRNANTGDLEYKQIAVKGDGAGGWDEQRIINIENNINNTQGDVTNIYEGMTYLCGWIGDVDDKVDDLSGKMDDLSNDFWNQGGNATNCYGTSIGNSAQGTVIGLDDRTLWSDWTVEGNLTADNVYVDTALTCSELTATALEATSIGSYSINCDGNFSCQSETTLGGNTDVFGTLAINNGNVLKIGNTTLSEAQLQALLALI